MTAEHISPSYEVWSQEMMEMLDKKDRKGVFAGRDKNSGEVVIVYRTPFQDISICDYIFGSRSEVRYLLPVPILEELLSNKK